MDAVWEQWDLVCTDPEGCDVLVRVLRFIAWSYLGIALLIFFVAIRAWTQGLHRALGIAVAAAGSLGVVWVGRAYVASTGSIRALLFLSGLGLLAAWIGRPGFTERSSRPEVATAATSPPGHPPTSAISEESPPTSATH